MDINFRKFLLLAVVGVSVGVLVSDIYFEIGLKQLPQPAKFIKELTPQEQWKIYLLEEVFKSKLSFKDFKKLYEVNECESNWKQFDKNGGAIISSGNIGIAQINKLAHETGYTKLGLDVRNPFDNLTYQVLLYKWEGLKPWRLWSGHCWENKIKNL